jgi:hypothetical protein
VTPSLYLDYAQRLLDCACAALEETTCGCPDWKAVIVGTVAWDACCEGMLYVAVGSVFPSLNFPEPATTRQPCMAPLAGTLTVGVARCAPTFDDQGNPPTCQQEQASAATAYEDAYAIMRGVVCCLHADRRLYDGVAGTQSFLGPLGGCVGSELTVTLSLVDPPPSA